GRRAGFREPVPGSQSLSLHDPLTAVRTAKRFTLRVRHEHAERRRARGRRARPRVPAGRDNLVLRAARLVARELGLPGGARFTLVKRIPVEAGMGGGRAGPAAAVPPLAPPPRRRSAR